MPGHIDPYDRLGQWLSHQVCRLWLWVRGLTPEDGPRRCGRCGHAVDGGWAGVGDR